MFLIVVGTVIGPSAESAMLISSLRDVIRNQTQEIESLQRQLQEKTNAGAGEVRLLPCACSVTD